MLQDPSLNEFIENTADQNLFKQNLTVRTNWQETAHSYVFISSEPNWWSSIPGCGVWRTREVQSWIKKNEYRAKKLQE